jgi:hypothetical protein
VVLKVFERLVDEQMRKCMSLSRDLILAKHAMAGLAAIAENYDLGTCFLPKTLRVMVVDAGMIALRLYRDALVRMDDMSRDFKIDKFQLIHALHNFIELQPLAQEEVSDEEMANKRDRLKAVETHLTLSATERVSSCWDSIKTVSSLPTGNQLLADVLLQLQEGNVDWDSWHWFGEVITALGPVIGTTSLVQALRSPLEKSPFDRNQIRLHLQLNSAIQIKATLVKESKKLQMHRAELLTRLQTLVGCQVLPFSVIQTKPLFLCRWRPCPQRPSSLLLPALAVDP